MTKYESYIWSLVSLKCTVSRTSEGVKGQGVSEGIKVRSVSEFRIQSVSFDLKSFLATRAK